MRESKFFEEVLAEGRVEGKVEQARASVLDALDVKFGAEAAAEFREALRGVTDLDQLSELLRLAIKSKRPAEFRRRLAAAAGQ
jgi:hypothetical protein